MFELRQWQALGHHSQTLQTYAHLHLLEIKWPYARQHVFVHCMSCCKAHCDQSDCSTGRPVCRPPRDNPRTLNTQLNAALANRKLSRFKEFAALYPECCWVFLGDNGQVR
jgi:hypothetical protein